MPTGPTAPASAHSGGGACPRFDGKLVILHPETKAFVIDMTANQSNGERPVTVGSLLKMKSEGRKIAMLTSYDYTMARLVDAAGVDIILIGDSASNVMAGNATTLPITMDEMIYHARSVARAARHALVVCDMPFGSYQASADQAVANAMRILKESGCDAVKLEGGRRLVPAISAMVDAGVPVMGHLGLTPQSIHKFGGYGLRAKEEAEAGRLLEDAKAIEEAGCFAIVLEKIPARLAAEAAREATVPIIGIGAGGGVDGQVLVAQDMLGMNQGFAPKFLRKYADLGAEITDAVGRYAADVRSGAYPSAGEQY